MPGALAVIAFLLGGCSSAPDRSWAGTWPSGDAQLGPTIQRLFPGVARTRPAPTPDAAVSPADAGVDSLPDLGVACGRVTCAPGQYCLVMGSVDPSVPGTAQCLDIPSGCVSCECLAPYSDCVCSQGNLLVACP